MPFEQRIPRPFTSNIIHQFAPIASGVYGISNAREWIFIGETEDIQGALLAHLETPLADLMKHIPTGFVFEVCPGGHRPGRHERLVREYGPSCNGQQVQRH